METAYPIARLVLLGLFVMMTASCNSATDTPAANATDAGVDNSAIVALHGGSTLIAERGTVGREIVDWLASSAPQGRFELGGRQFDGRSAEPTIEAQARLTRLIQMLKSDSDVHILLVGHSDRSADAAADQALSEARARAVRRILEASGIFSTRIKVEGRGGTQPIADDRTPAGRAQNQRVSLELTRHR
ncbi:OmpA family protein [Sphingomonas sp. JC676]|uniref:OmpA family protein n=1 Tax=Sphingomonas sp. JC676 TaxID=2768065 RepID=UPI00165827D3|nr:OmpA family protein [Sphingomonas sp. JC676]MBC9032642.1 OmpA family protein [Sphingomonas sp. JC676]